MLKGVPALFLLFPSAVEWPPQPCIFPWCLSSHQSDMSHGLANRECERVTHRRESDRGIMRACFTMLNHVNKISLVRSSLTWSLSLAALRVSDSGLVM